MTTGEKQKTIIIKHIFFKNSFEYFYAMKTHLIFSKKLQILKYDLTNGEIDVRQTKHNIHAGYKNNLYEIKEDRVIVINAETLKQKDTIYFDYKIKNIHVADDVINIEDYNNELHVFIGEPQVI
jgi:hypothetical protein